MAGKIRSPNYPALSLAQALQAAGKLWNAEKRTPVGHEAAALALGFKSLSGPARVTIGALRQYGFIVKGEKGQVRLSDLAVAALHGNPDDKQAAMRQAAVHPRLFKELAQNYTDASETAISSYLITKKSFAEDGARKAARAFRATIKLAKPEASGYTQQENREEPETMTGVQTGQIQKAGEGGGNQPDGVFALNVPFSRGTIAVQVRTTGTPLTAAHLARVCEYLKLAESDLKESEKGHLHEIADLVGGRSS